MQKEAFTREGKAARAAEGIFSAVVYNHLIGSMKKARVRRSRLRSGIEELDEIQKQAEEASAKVISTINSMTGAAIRPPKIEIETSPKKRAIVRGYFSYATPDTIFITPLPAKDIVETATHESIHYARTNLLGRDTGYHTSKVFLKASIEEGVAQFIEQYFNIKENGHREGTILKDNDRAYFTLSLATYLYSSIEEDLRSAFRTPRFTERTISSQFISPIGPYAIGSAAIEILLLRNDLDLEKTAVELLTHSNTDIIRKVVDAVSTDFDHKLKKKIDALLIFREQQKQNADRTFEITAKDIVLKDSVRDPLNSSYKVETIIVPLKRG